MSGFGLTVGEIAVIIGVSAPTVRRHFKVELATGVAEANVKVASALYKTATQGSGRDATTAAIFWLKARAQWAEAQGGGGAAGAAGKKVRQLEEARTAGHGSGWGHDLDPPPGALPN